MVVSYKFPWKYNKYDNLHVFTYTKFFYKIQTLKIVVVCIEGVWTTYLNSALVERSDQNKELYILNAMMHAILQQ